MSLSSFIGYVIYHMHQVLRLMAGRKDAQEKMDISARGFVLSFFAFLLFQALYIAYVLLSGIADRTPLFLDNGFYAYWRGMFAEWLYPVALLLLISLRKRYRDDRDRLIITQNWAVGIAKFPLALALSINPDFTYGIEIKLILTILFVIVGFFMLIRVYIALLDTESLLLPAFLTIIVMGGAYYVYDHFYDFGHNLAYLSRHAVS